MNTTNDISPTQWYAVWRWKLHWQILLGLIVGALLGYVSALVALNAAEAAGDQKQAAGIVTARWDYLLYDLLGDLFLNGLKLIIIPLVTSSIVLAITGMGARAGFGRLGLKTLGYYLTTSTIAILIGLVLVNVVNPGQSDPDKPLFTTQSAANFESEAKTMTDKSAGKTGTDFLDVFRTMVPDNPVKAAVEGNLLGLIVVSLLVGFFLTRIAERQRHVMTDFWQAIYDISMAVTSLVLRFAPIGVGMMIAATVAENYARLTPDDRFDEFGTSIVKFTVTVLVALALHAFVVLPLLLAFVARVNPLRHFKAMGPALMTAFSTASSSATLPVTLNCVENRAGVSNRTGSFVLPLGATVNMDGTALYECVAAIFIVQAFGVELSFGQQFFVVMVALLTSIGVAGVPSASLVAIVIILDSLTTQVANKTDVTYPFAAVGMPILLVFDRLLDMCRTAVNVFSDSCGAIVVAKSEGEAGVLTDHVTDAPATPESTEPSDDNDTEETP